MVEVAVAAVAEPVVRHVDGRPELAPVEQAGERHLGELAAMEEPH